MSAVTAESYEQLGRTLRDARLARKIEIVDAGRRLHIRHRYLQALEDGSLSELPGDTYIKGYLRRYADYLALPADELVSAYQQIGALQPQRMFFVPEHIRKEKHPARPLVGLTLILALLVFLLWGAVHPRLPVAPSAKVPPPPIAAPVQTAIASPSCLARATAVWPPCYYVRKNTLPAQISLTPARTIMELY